MRYCFLRFPEGKFKAVTLSYDDGVQADIRLAGILDKYGMKGTFNINTGFFGNPGKMTPEEIKGAYEKETGTVIIERFNELSINPDDVPGVVVYSHGPFTWGTDPHNAVHNAVVLEEISFMAWHNLALSGGTLPQMQQELLDKHYLRKHGANAYYGQGK